MTGGARGAAGGTAAARGGDEIVAKDIRRIAQLSDDAPIPSAKELAETIFTTVYLGTENSSSETRARATALAKDIGASHLSVAIDVVTTSSCRQVCILEDSEVLERLDTRVNHLAMQFPLCFAFAIILIMFLSSFMILPTMISDDDRRR